MNNHISTIIELDRTLTSNHDSEWMGYSPNLAILISIGAGPWQEPRRVQVQRAAIDWYIKQKVDDLLYANPPTLPVYPIFWQQRCLAHIISFLKLHDQQFSNFCDGIKRHNDIQLLFKAFGCPPSGYKVIWMFARDFLEIPAFPIDRHVKRVLLANNLPIDSRKMVELCLEANVSPNVLNRKFFSGKNPDWSHLS